MSYNPLTIANKIVALKGNNLTIMELLKLQYIAHGYSLAILNKPLFKGRVEAWPYGPVVKEVYDRFRNDQGIHISRPISSSIAEEEKIEDNCVKVIEGVVENYKGKNGWELSALTHEANSPWTKTVSDKGFYSEIPDKLIQDYYEGLIGKND